MSCKGALPVVCYNTEQPMLSKWRGQVTDGGGTGGAGVQGPPVINKESGMEGKEVMLKGIRR